MQAYAATRLFWPAHERRLAPRAPQPHSQFLIPVMDVNQPPQAEMRWSEVDPTCEFESHSHPYRLPPPHHNPPPSPPRCADGQHVDRVLHLLAVLAITTTPRPSPSPTLAPTLTPTSTTPPPTTTHTTTTATTTASTSTATSTSTAASTSTSAPIHCINMNRTYVLFIAFVYFINVRQFRRNSTNDAISTSFSEYPIHTTFMVLSQFQHM